MKTFLWAGVLLVLAVLTPAVTANDIVADFLPIAEQINQGRNAEGIKAAVAAAPKNPLAAALLYLIYSRGYCGEPVDYRKTMDYYKLAFALQLPGRGFCDKEYDRVLRSAQLPPSGGFSQITVPGWYGDKIIPLHGQRPFKECYGEVMANIGGLPARVLYESGEELSPNPQPVKQAMRREAARLGNPLAMMAPVEPSGTYLSTQEQLGRVRAAADAGYVPAMLIVADALSGNSRQKFMPLDPATARKYAKQAEKICIHYADSPFGNIDSDLKKARELTAMLVWTDRSTPEILAEWKRDNTNEGKVAMLIAILKTRNDSPECAFLRGHELYQTNPEEGTRQIEAAAEAGSVLALRHLLNSGRNSTNYWRYLYWAGKYGLPEKDGGNYFYQAKGELDQQQIRMSPTEYRANFGLLAQANPVLMEEYVRMYRVRPGETADPATLPIVQVDDPETVSVQPIPDFPGGCAYRCIFKASKQRHYAEWTNLPDLKKSEEIIEIQPLSGGGLSSNMVRIRAADSKGHKLDTGCSNMISLFFHPEKVRMTAEKQDQDVELRVVFR